ncbi:MAG: RagB/SusD family nutrient uptake outer membrane protein [Rikenellaceae bacterium]
MKKLKYILISSLILAASSSCQMLEPMNENVLGEDYVASDAESVEGLLLNAYSVLVSHNGWGGATTDPYSSVATDDAVINQSANSFLRMATGELTSQYNPYGTYRWNANYESIFYVNKFLSMVDDAAWNSNEALSELYCRRLKGEALALRALHHFKLMEAFAGVGSNSELLGVQYYDEFIDPDGDFSSPRLSFEDMADAIMADFEEAFELLPTIYSDDAADIPEKDSGYDTNTYLVANSTVYDQRMCGRIVRALQARFKLFIASEAYLNSSAEYENAAAYAAGVLESCDYTLAADGIEFYDSDGDLSNPEVLWSVSRSLSSTAEGHNFPPSLNGTGYINPTHNFVSAFPMADGYPIDKSPYYDAQNPFANRDPRLAKFVLYDGATYGGVTINTNYDSATNDALNLVSGQSTRTGYYLKKMLRPDVIIPVSGTVTTQYHYYALVRYTEMFLILAEAQNEIGGPDYKVDGSQMSAREIIRAIRARALGISSDLYLDSISSQEDMRDMIRNERRLELSFEGFRFWDLRRWAADLDETATGYYNSGSGYQEFDVEKRVLTGEKYKYMPLPYTEVRKYGLIQNYGW